MALPHCRRETRMQEMHSVQKKVGVFGKAQLYHTHDDPSMNQARNRNLFSIIKTGAPNKKLRKLIKRLATYWTKMRSEWAG